MVFPRKYLLLKMLIGKIIAIAQRRRINFHGKRGEEKKTLIWMGATVCSPPSTHPFTLKANLLKRSQARW